MNFDIAIRKTVTSALRHPAAAGPRRFELQVRFTTSARRTVIFGPSGAGKSLTLQAIAGLLTPDAGRIAFGNEVLFDSSAGIDVPARNRRFGYLFQDYALFPQLNVRQNVAFALQPGWRNPSAYRNNDGSNDGSDDAVVERWLRRFELTEVASQRPDELSGGQRQRTALARALVHSPRALLLDEPFSALDPALRRRMRSELDELLQRIEVPVLMITHDQDDLEWFGDQTLYLSHGTISSVPPPAEEPDAKRLTTA